MPGKGHTREPRLNKFWQVEITVAGRKGVGQAVCEIGVRDHTRSTPLRAGFNTGGDASTVDSTLIRQKWLERLEQENARLKRTVADLARTRRS